MSDAKHTPGPWIISNRRIVAAQTGVVLAELFSPSASDYKGTQFEANARLIKASPRLLEACKLVCAELGERYDVDEPELGHPKEIPFAGCGELMLKVQAAIDEAEGRS